MKQIIIVVAAAAVGAAGAWFLKPTEQVKAAPAKVQQHAARVAEVAPAAADVTPLQKRIKELEEELAAATNKEEVAAAPAPHRPSNFNERMEEMKVKDPERYAATTNRMAQMRNAHHEDAIKRLEFLVGIDTRGMSKQELENHEALQETIVRLDEMGAKMMAGTMSNEERMKAWGETMTLWQQMGDMAEKERKVLLRQTAKALGTDARDFTATINSIIDSTSALPNNWRRGFGGGHHGGQHGPRK